MDPLRLAFRAILSYIVLLVLVRISGKRTVRHGHPFDFTVALVMGDLVDDIVWGEVAVGQFVTASVVVFSAHAWLVRLRWRLGSRTS
jgi:uncharacterized membrane protein YcaP (DUF421 family)